MSGIRGSISLQLATALLAASASASFAQVGNIEQPYPGWVPSDRVDPEIDLTESYDSATGLWTYAYAIRNGPDAEQDIWEFDLRIGAWVTQTTAPTGWGGYATSGSTFGLITRGFASALFNADLPPDFEGPYWSPSDYQIPPGDSLSGFVLTSPYPPGYARTYVQGYSGSLFPPDPAENPDAYYAMKPVPHDTTDSQRGWTLGPTIYTTVLTPGDDGLTTDNFLGWMNISDFATTLIDPAPVAIKFSVIGETVFPETFRATLNGVDVTEAFLPGPPDGADRVAVFRLGGSPLVEGLNVIETSIEGIEGFTRVRAPDIDVMRFRVQPGCDASQSIACP